MPRIRIIGSYKPGCPRTEERLDRLARLILLKAHRDKKKGNKNGKKDL